MPNHSHRPSRNRRRRNHTRSDESRRGLGTSNSERQSLLSSQQEGAEENVRFAGLQGVANIFGRREENAEVTQGDAAVKAAYLTYQEGVALHGEDGSWESTGSNRGPVVDDIQEANDSSGQAWCGMFIGDSYDKAGIRQEILERLVFWSGYRLHLFFTEGRHIHGAFGDWCQAHQTTQIGSGTGEQRKEKLDAFAPQPGDIALFRSDYSHVGMVTSYDSATGNLEIIEGNRGNRVQATVYDTGDGEITFLGRFNSSDYEPGGSVDEGVASAAMPEVEHTEATGSTR